MPYAKKRNITTEAKAVQGSFRVIFTTPKGKHVSINATGSNLLGVLRFALQTKRPEGRYIIGDMETNEVLRPMKRLRSFRFAILRYLKIFTTNPDAKMIIFVPEERTVEVFYDPQAYQGTLQECNQIENKSNKN